MGFRALENSQRGMRRNEGSGSCEVGGEGSTMLGFAAGVQGFKSLELHAV